jgi:hypothetical protein
MNDLQWALLYTGLALPVVALLFLTAAVHHRLAVLGEGVRLIAEAQLTINELIKAQTAVLAEVARRG